MGKSVTARRLAAAVLLLVPLLAPLQSLGAGLGKLTVHSALGQPLSAEIEIVSVQSGEEDSLAARFAPPEAYRQAGIEFNSAVLGVRFAVERRNGKPIIKLVSNAPINEPFVNMLVELSWNAGRLVREYTFLLDPVDYKGVQPIAQAPAAMARPAPAARPVEARPMATPPVAASQQTYEVVKGDTLGRIAAQKMPAGVTLQQMLIALYRANPDAFISNNINRLRAGRILKVPGTEEAAAIEQAEARKIVSEHAREFRAYSSTLAGAVAAAPADASAGRQSSAGKITAKSDEPAAESKDQVRLSKADPADKGARASAARADNAAASQKALQETESRVAELEKTVKDLQKLLELKNQSLAELEKKAGIKPAAPAPVPAAKPVEPLKAPPPAAPAAAEPAKTADAAKPMDAAKSAEAPKAPEAAAAAGTAKAPEPPKASAPPPKPKPKFAPPPPPPPPPSLLDEFLNPVAMGGLGGVLLLLVGYGYWAWKRKKATQSKFQDSVMGASSTDSLGAASVFSGAGGSDVDTGSSVSEVSVGEVSVASPDSDEVDPIAEADVYMAYGRDTQAEEILKDALTKDPERLELHAKLAEIYAGRGDGEHLEQSMMKVKDLTGGQGAEWDRLVAIARAADPTNGLYGGDVDATVMIRPAAPPAAAAAPTLDFDLDSAAPAEEPAKESFDGAATVASTPGPASIDFDLGGADAPAAGSPEEEKTDFAPGGTIIVDTPSESPADSSGGLDFDLGMGDEEKPAEPASAEAQAGDGGGGGLDFNLDAGSDADKTVMMPSGTKPDMDLSDISFDLGTLDAAAPAGAEADPHWQEIATKLDLAKAYEEMGDKDGARDLLNEVAKEGDEAQQKQAREMLDKLG